MKNPLLAEAILAGQDVVVTVIGNELAVGALKMNLKRTDPRVSFGGSRVLQDGLEQTVRIPASDVEGIRHSIISALNQSPLDIQFQPQPHHENPSPS
jgi:hypothetical protein